MTALTRIATASVFLPLFYLLIKKAPPLYFTAFLIATAAVATWEYFKLVEATGHDAYLVPGFTFTMLAVGLFAFGNTADASLPILGGLFAFLLTALARKNDPFPKRLGSAALGFLCVPYIGVCLGHQALLIGLENHERATDLVFLLYLIVWCGDTGAYLVGKSIGKHKLAPSLSPGKSWEGAVGNVLASTLGASLAKVWFIYSLSWTDIIILGVGLSIAGQFGDLCESLIKRAAGIKDSGGVLPGHGGILDRADSLLFTAPLLYYYHQHFMSLP